MTRKLGFIVLLFSTLFMVACSGRIQIEGPTPIIGSTSYFGADLAGGNFVATHIEFGMNTNNVFALDPGSLQLQFDPITNLISGNKNCRLFTAASEISGNQLSIQFINYEVGLCPIEQSGFPTEVSLEDSFLVEVYYDFGNTLLVLKSLNQDLTIYLEQSF